MTTSDFLTDSAGKAWKVTPDAFGELAQSDAGLTDVWSDASYVIPIDASTYRELSDGAGTTWYLYVDTFGELVISTTAPGDGGTWRDAVYGSEVTPTEAITGDEIYLALQDSDDTDWYVYPDSNGELIITNAEPS